jgi:hypothetical protein
MLIREYRTSYVKKGIVTVIRSIFFSLAVFSAIFATTTVNAQTNDDDLVTMFANVRDFQEIRLLPQTYIIHEPIVLRDKKEVTIICEDETQILCTDSQRDVLRIELCDNISIENGSFGHRIPEDESCSEAVFTIRGSRSVSITNCEIFGCGAIGVQAEGCADIFLVDCTIRDNSWTAYYLFTCDNISAINCMYEGNFTFLESNNCTNLDLEGWQDD